MTYAIGDRVVINYNKNIGTIIDFYNTSDWEIDDEGDEYERDFVEYRIELEDGDMYYLEETGFKIAVPLTIEDVLGEAFEEQIHV